MTKHIKQLLGILFLSVLFLLGSAGGVKAQQSTLIKPLKVMPETIEESLFWVPYTLSIGFNSKSPGYQNNTYVDKVTKVSVKKGEAFEEIRRTERTSLMTQGELSYLILPSDKKIVIGSLQLNAGESITLKIEANGYLIKEMTIKKEISNRKTIFKIPYQKDYSPVEPVKVNFEYMDGFPVADSIEIDKGSVLKQTQLPSHIKGSPESILWFDKKAVTDDTEKIVDERLTEEHTFGVFETKIEKDLTLVAVRIFPVSFTYDKNTEIASARENSKVAIPEIISEWRDFDGEFLQIKEWKNGENTFSLDSKISENLTLIAVPKDKFTVTFQYNDGEDQSFTKKVYENGTITLTEEEKALADKWVTGDDEKEFEFATLITEDITIKGIKTPPAPSDNGSGNNGNRSQDESSNGQSDSQQGDSGNNGNNQGFNQQENNNQDGAQASEEENKDYIAAIIEPLPMEESSKATEDTTDNSIVISDETTPLSAGEMSKVEALISEYNKIAMKDIKGKGHKKLFKSYYKLTRKLNSKKIIEKEAAALYKKLLENKSEFYKVDYNIQKLEKSVITGTARKNLFELIKALSSYKMEAFSEKAYNKLFKKYMDGINALNSKSMSDQKITAIYKSLLQEKKVADQSRKASN